MFETPPILPASAKRLATDDLDEFRIFMDGYGGQVRRVACGGGPLGLSIAAAAGRTVAAAQFSAKVGHSARAATRLALLHVPVSGSRRYRIGRTIIEPRSEEIVFLPPSDDVTVSYAAGATAVIQIDAGTLGRELAAQAGRPVADSLLLPRAFRVGTPAVLHLRTLLEDWSAAHRPDESIEWRAQTLCAAEARLADWVAGLHDPGDAEGVGRGRAMRRVRATEEWVEAHLGEPITLGRLCELTGMGKRCLQRAFESRRGLTPLEYVQQRRLAAARRRLMWADSSSRVTEVAMDCGFTHMGRFSVAYARAFGERPSATLRRRS